MEQISYYLYLKKLLIKIQRYIQLIAYLNKVALGSDLKINKFNNNISLTLNKIEMVL